MKDSNTVDRILRILLRGWHSNLSFKKLSIKYEGYTSLKACLERGGIVGFCQLVSELLSLTAS